MHDRYKQIINLNRAALKFAIQHGQRETYRLPPNVNAIKPSVPWDQLTERSQNELLRCGYHTLHPRNGANTLLTPCYADADYYPSLPPKWHILYYGPEYQNERGKRTVSPLIKLGLLASFPQHPTLLFLTRKGVDTFLSANSPGIEFWDELAPARQWLKNHPNAEIYNFDYRYDY